jgi:anti-sigma-K factor RskA
MAHDRKPRSWLRLAAIALAVFAVYVALGVLTFQDSPEDPPLIVSLLSDGR